MTAGRPRRRLVSRGAGLAAALVIAIGFPWVFSNPTVTSIAIITLVYMASATAWNSFGGYTGYIPLGHAVFFGCGAYTLALLAEVWHMKGGYAVFALLPLGAVVAAVVAVPFGWVALRTRRHTFVVITIAIFFIFQLLAYNLAFTHGSSGAQTPTPPWPAATYNDPFYYVALAVVIFAVALSWTIRRSRFGLQLLAIRDDEDRARSLGVRVGRVKLAAFVMSAVPIGMGGGIYAYFIGQIYPQFAFNPLFDLAAALMSFLGGLGTVAGPVLGALILEPLQQYFTLQFPSGGLYLILYGVLFLVVILLLPRGIIPTLADRFKTALARRRGTVRVATEATAGDLPVPAGASAGSATATGTVDPADPIDPVGPRLERRRG
ncbi:MAG: branched-chain amino acid ABC transporter permease [Acidimicrobiales bacterium]